jgi:hypothetical protein
MSTMSPVKTLPGWLRIRSIITVYGRTTAMVPAPIPTSSRQRPKTADDSDESVSAGSGAFTTAILEHDPFRRVNPSNYISSVQKAVS